MPALTYDPLWLRRFHEADVGARLLVCLPHAGGSASFYFPFSAAFSPDAQVLAVQYPGRQDRRGEPCVESIAELAESICDVVSDVEDFTKVAFFGHSMGAVLAFEVAGMLERRHGVSPDRLFVSGRRAPSRVRPDNVHCRGDLALLAELEALGGTTRAQLADPELRGMFLPALRADYHAIESYRCRPGATVSCPITVLTGDADPRTTVEEAWDWRLHTKAACAMHTFAGGHFFLNDHLRSIVELVGTTLERAR